MASRFSLRPLSAAPNATPGPSRLPAIRHRAWRAKPRHVIAVRYNSTAPAPSPRGSSAAIPHPNPAFEELATSLSASQPCFGARGDEITLLTSPTEFYAKLLEMFKRARRRILISSLYIGAEEAELVETIRAALQSNPFLKVTFILDYHRGTRLSASTEHPASTAHLLLPLVEQYQDRCEVWLYRSPKLKGIMERIVPERYDEGWGTWHGKWYCVDDEVVISGANLAGSYFTNRQDRYIHFRSHPKLLSYLSSLTRLFTQYSYLLSPSSQPSASRHYLVPLPSPTKTPTYFGGASLVWPTQAVHPRSFQPHALATLTAFQNSWRSANAERLRRVDVDTWFWPVIQAGVLGIKEEEAALAKVWRAVGDAWKTEEEDKVSVDLTSGYFGLYKSYKRAVVDSPAPVRIITASPKANGFFGSAGFSRLVPEGYTLLEKRFWRDCQIKGRLWQKATGLGVRLREWERKGWTYHAKGIWLSSSKSPSTPFMTFIGSSNLSTRSLTLDTELSLIMTTSSPSLRRALGAELKVLDKHTADVGEETWQKPERRVSPLAKVLVALGVEGML